MSVFNDEMLTIEEVADYLKLKPQTIYKWAQTGKIPGAKFGKEWRFRRSLIETWIDNHIASSTKKNSHISSSTKENSDSSPQRADSGPVKN